MFRIRNLPQNAQSNNKNTLNEFDVLIMRKNHKFHNGS